MTSLSPGRGFPKISGFALLFPGGRRFIGPLCLRWAGFACGVPLCSATVSPAARMICPVFTSVFTLWPRLTEPKAPWLLRRSAAVLSDCEHVCDVKRRFIAKAATGELALAALPLERCRKMSHAGEDMARLRLLFALRFDEVCPRRLWQGAPCFGASAARQRFTL